MMQNLLYDAKMVQTTEATLERYYELADILADRQLTPKEKEELGFIENNLMPAMKDHYTEILTEHRTALFKEQPHAFGAIESRTLDPFSCTRTLYERRFASKNIQLHLEKILEGDNPDIDQAGSILAVFAARSELNSGMLQYTVQEKVLNYHHLHFIPELFQEILGMEEKEHGPKKHDMLMDAMTDSVRQYKNFSKDFEMDFMLKSLRQKLENVKDPEQRIAQITKFKDYFMKKLHALDAKKIVMNVKSELDDYVEETYVPLQEEQREMYQHLRDIANERAEIQVPKNINYEYVAVALAIEDTVNSAKAGEQIPQLVAGSITEGLAKGYRPLSGFEKEYIFKAIVSDKNYSRFVKFVEKMDDTMAPYEKEVAEKLKAVREIPAGGIHIADEVNGKIFDLGQQISPEYKKAKAEYLEVRKKHDEAYNEVMESEFEPGWRNSDLLRKYPFAHLSLVSDQGKGKMDLGQMFGLDAERTKELYEAHAYKEPSVTSDVSVLDVLHRFSNRIMGFMSGQDPEENN